MKKCNFDILIDDYLLNKLEKKEKENFEEHYFNCEPCFEKMVARDELIAVIKNQGHRIFADEERPEEKKEVFSFGKILSFLTPKQWAYAAVSVSVTLVLLVVMLNVVPFQKKTTPTQQPFYYEFDEGRVRGENLRLISPVIDIEAVPSQFMWAPLGDNVEYKISIYFNHHPFWTATTKENTISLPDDVKNRMQASRKYSWQVKAFSPQGTLLAVSPKVQFKITAE
ncbi:MAG: hypothetical protein GTO17_05170 [Candidatus Aminicenantes bacterium]|nr:hypothetical protein [Candidatus Aminicenantes bacterium]